MKWRGLRAWVRDGAAVSMHSTALGKEARTVVLQFNSVA